MLSLIGTHGHVVATLLAEVQDVQGSVILSASGREELRPECCGSAWLSTYFGKVKKDGWKARGWGLSYGVDSDNEYVLRSLMWADN